MLPVCIGSYLKSFLMYKYLILDTCYVSKDVRIRGYFSKPQVVREQEKSGKH